VAGLIIAHQGSTDPATEGFTPDACCAPSTVGPIANDVGFPAWSIAGSATNSQFAYISGTLSAAQMADIATQGFVLTLEARVLQGLAPVYDAVNPIVIVGAAVEIGSKRIEIELGLDSNGDTVAVLPTSIDSSGPGQSVRAFGPSFTLTGSDSTYHNYQLVFDPGTQLADLFVDGVDRIQDYAGNTSFALNRGLGWGAWSGGQGNFNVVQLAAPQIAVPEPSSLLLLSIGGLGLTLCLVFRQTKHRQSPVI
jgi:hypothetical protein